MIPEILSGDTFVKHRPMRNKVADEVVGVVDTDRWADFAFSTPISIPMLAGTYG